MQRLQIVVRLMTFWFLNEKIKYIENIKNIQGFCKLERKEAQKVKRSNDTNPNLKPFQI